MSFITGAGSTNVDLIYENIKRLPSLGEEVFSEGFSVRLGGGIPATLINLSRLGIKTKIATELGGDMFSLFAKDEFEKAGASLYSLKGKSKIPLTVTSVISQKSDRTFLSYSGYTEPDDEMKEAFYKLSSGAKITLMQKSGYTEVYRKLKNEGTILVLDTGWDDNMSLESYKEYLELADYYTPNKAEAMKITNTASPLEAAKALKKHFERVIVKLDSEGCLGIDENGKRFTVKSIESFKHVDSTGAGDAFLAGFCYGLYKGFSFEDSILAGNVTGGKAVTDYGALSAYCTEEELLGYIKAYKK